MIFTSYSNIMKRIIPITLTIIVLVLSQFSIFAMAAEPTLDISSPDFSFSICAGPVPRTGPVAGVVYCNFEGLMLTVQHLINIAMIVGVITALGSFCYVGYLYMTGVPGKITKAREILPKIFYGFIIMLSAWFIVYQLLTWLGVKEGLSLFVEP